MTTAVAATASMVNFRASMGQKRVMGMGIETASVVASMEAQPVLAADWVWGFWSPARPR